MVTRLPEMMMDGVHDLFKFGAMGTWTDDQLVARFLARREGSEVAFRVLIQRHGPMVLGVCHRVLGDAHLAEDTFQATFLVLVRKAATLRDRGLLANWLYGVAHRLANKARVEATRRRVVEQGAARSDVGFEEDTDRDELRSVIDEEIQRLPERYRAPLVLCYLEGLHHHEVARRLGCPVGTVESRLSRARRRLHSQLTRRGLAPISAALTALAPSRAPASFERLTESTLLAARRAAADLPYATQLASHAASLGRGPRASVLARPGAVWTALISVGVIAAGFGLVMASNPPANRQPPPVVTPEDQPDVVPVVTPVSEATEPPVPPQPTRSPSALARPLHGITLDGDLGDWPKDLPRYPIRSQVPANGTYRSASDGEDLDAYFQVGYEPKAGLVYLAAVVRDDDVVANPSDPWHTDAVEIYVDGSFSDRAIPLKENPWGTAANATRMPALQYAAVPGEVAAYADPRKANPSLVYGRIGDTNTRMRYRQTGDVVTYEWAIQAFDQYPDRPTRLVLGNRIALDVAVVDKDRDQDRPSWQSWAPYRGTFKGFDAGQLGELILVDDP